MNVSIVIPVYNEAERLGACLEAIARLRPAPFEVIVVDNNSTDASASIAAAYSFVTLLHAPKQGVVHARNSGFNAARGDIIGRIDADTLLPPDWIAQLSTIMTDQSIAAVSGSVAYYDLPVIRFNAALDLWFRRRIARGMGSEVFLYGANMAIRRSVWQQVRAHTCSRGKLHEDFDLAIHANRLGHRNVFDARLHAYVSLRRVDVNVREFWSYAWLNPQTYAVHGLKSQRHMYPAIALVLGFFWLLKLLHKGFDPATGRFSVYTFLTADITPPRVNPATFGD